MTNSEKLIEIIDRCGAAGEGVLSGESDGAQYRDALLELLGLMKTVSTEDIRGAGFADNIQNTLLMDQHLIEDTVTEEIDQLSLLSTAVTYIACNREGKPGHSAAYMDKVTELRKALEKEYDTEAIRFCGRDGC